MPATLFTLSEPGSSCRVPSHRTPGRRAGLPCAYPFFGYPFLAFAYFAFASTGGAMHGSD